MGKSVFDLITDSLANERLDGILLQNPQYEKTSDEINRLAEELKERDLSVEETKAVNRLICAYLTQSGIYGQVSYQQGFKDAVALLIEIGLIKQANNIWEGRIE